MSRKCYGDIKIVGVRMQMDGYRFVKEVIIGLHVKISM
jgi:hypothetical protein